MVLKMGLGTHNVRKSLHKIKILYILCKHMCQGAKKEEGSEFWRSRGFLRPEGNELEIIWVEQGGSGLKNLEQHGQNAEGEQVVML